MSNLVTEYKEQGRVAKAQDLESLFNLKDNGADQEEMVITFVEPPHPEMVEQQEPIIMINPEDIVEFSECGDVDEIMDSSDMGAMEFKLPGATDYVDDDDDEVDEAKDHKEEKETDWKSDRDPCKFMPYILQAYPDGIPYHDGSSTLGCERAVLYLNNLNKEISEALRSDKNDDLDLKTLEKIRVDMVRDNVILKEHIKKLNKKHKKASISGEEFVKEATTPRVQLVMTPFERAITGIIINSVVSAGKPFEDVYESLKKKYSFTDREELTIMQLLMDMGQPIFKDRGTIGEGTLDRDSHGVDFVKNYFA